MVLSRCGSGSGPGGTWGRADGIHASLVGGERPKRGGGPVAVERQRQAIFPGFLSSTAHWRRRFRLGFEGRTSDLHPKQELAGKASALCRLFRCG